MAFFQWTQTLSVGIEEIDEEHKIWIVFLNKLHDAVGSGTDYEELSGILHDVISFSKQHFINEENMFTESDYPDADKHKQLHKDYLEELQMLSDLCSPQTTEELTLDSLLSLKKWLVDHIQEVDKQYAPYVKKNL